MTASSMRFTIAKTTWDKFLQCTFLFISEQNLCESGQEDAILSALAIDLSVARERGLPTY